MTTLRAHHFDGRVLIPDEPVDLPQGQMLELEVKNVGEVQTLPIGIEDKTGLPYFDVPPETKIFTSEDVRRALEDE